ncbi:DUF2608 domain-containing protein [Xanthomonas tesorieronis]|uniref:DUF2608 domain-containing protein n=1 Tax=Xanthomonas tesorieronis TaxID=3160839 RepID=UPI0035121EFE
MRTQIMVFLAGLSVAVAPTLVYATDPPAAMKLGTDAAIPSYRNVEADASPPSITLRRLESAPASKYARHEDLRDVISALESSNVKTLVVFDIDDTLLTEPEFFGSDSWYEWQYRMAKAAPKGTRPPGYVPCTFDVIALNQEAARQNFTQADAVAIFNSIETDKILITSRSPVSRGATERELTQRRDEKMPGYALPPHLAGTDMGWMYTITIGDRTVDMSYHHGLFMTNGANKGLALRDLLRRLGKEYGFRPEYKRIIMADDGENNITNMDLALRGSGIEFVPIWYTKVIKQVPTDAPDDSLRVASNARWEKLAAFWREAFPDRFNVIKNQNQCHYGGLITGVIPD